MNSLVTFKMTTKCVITNTQKSSLVTETDVSKSIELKRWTETRANQWFSEGHQYLTAQNVEQSGGCRGIADDPVYIEKLSSHDLIDGLAGRSAGFGSGHVSTIVVAKLKKSLQSSGRMFRSLGLHTVRQRQHQSHLSAPFRLPGAQIAVYNGLKVELRHNS